MYVSRKTRPAFDKPSAIQQSDLFCVTPGIRCCLHRGQHGAGKRRRFSGRKGLGVFQSHALAFPGHPPEAFEPNSCGQNFAINDALRAGRKYSRIRFFLRVNLPIGHAINVDWEFGSITVIRQRSHTSAHEQTLEQYMTRRSLPGVSNRVPIENQDPDDDQHAIRTLQHTPEYSPRFRGTFEGGIIRSRGHTKRYSVNRCRGIKPRWRRCSTCAVSVLHKVVNNRCEFRRSKASGVRELGAGGKRGKACLDLRNKYFYRLSQLGISPFFRKFSEFIPNELQI